MQEIKNSLKEAQILEIDFIKLTTFLNNQMHKKKYKIVIQQIEKSEDSFKKYNKKWCLNYMKLKAILKILNHKLGKYSNKLQLANSNIQELSNIQKKELSIIQEKYKYKSVSTIVDLMKIKIIETFTRWFEKFEAEIEILKKYTEENNDTFIIEKIIQCYLKYFLIRSLYAEIQGYIIDAICFLCHGYKIITKLKHYIKEGDTFREATKILLRISKFYILNKDFINAKKNIKLALNFTLKEIFLYSDNYSNLSTNNKMYRTYLNLSLIFTYIGIINEYDGIISTAVYAYKQSKWILMKLIYEKYPLMANLGCLILERSQIYYRALNWVIKEEKLLQFRKIKNSLEVKNRRLLSKNYVDKMLGLKMKKSIEDFLNNLSIPLIDGIDKNVKRFHIDKKNKSVDDIERNTSDYVMSTLKLLNIYLSKDFKPILNNMKDINIIDIDYNIKGEIQKIVNNKVFRKEMDYYQRKKNIEQNNIADTLKEKENYNQINKFGSSIENNSLEQINNMQNIFKSMSAGNIISTREKDNLNKKTYLNYLNLDAIHSGKVVKYKNQKELYEYKKSYKDKKDYINKLTNKEISFLHKILLLKKNEKLTFNEVKNLREIEIEAKRDFKTIKSLVKPREEKKEPVKLTLKEIKTKKKRISITNQMLKSLNPKLGEALNFELHQDVIDLIQKKNSVNFEKLELNAEYKDNNRVNNNNNEYIKKISSEIVDIAKTEQHKQKEKIRLLKSKNKKFFSLNNSNNNTINGE